MSDRSAAPLSSEPTVAVSRGDARTLVRIARRGDLSGAERLVAARLAARIDDYDEAAER